MSGLPAPLPAVLAHYPLVLDGATASAAPSGLIHRTFVVELPGGARVVAQRVNPIFGPEVLRDIEAVTGFLESEGLATTRLLRTRAGELGVRDDEGALWRLLRFVDGVTYDRVERPGLARGAAGLVARFHRAVGGLDYAFASVRAGVHDTAGHLARLEAAVETGGPYEALGRSILAEARRLPPLGDLPRRITHGDLKISNVLFARGSDEAVGLIDLDTLGRLPLAYELGDAWRSWCNPLGEDVEETRFDVDTFAAAVEGYAAFARPEPVEIASLVPGLWTVCVELAARFCVDAFEDRYFGWDAKRFASRREHNRVRAAGQLSLARAVGAARVDAEALVSGAFATP